eukprot:CAMPEP_0115009112 /NCGR_PEP_ID=MMETSP0216-20121206/22388_1 /TAXON_ID=223996 /ORGANISM="Protocruzia adherens, Strain Boccale" /LENGTH=376 /DNA_ID=CAMNT_0002376797 /DNA_START=91 /DNA_END=1221 /DNA_ORIENTATION=-
MLAAGKVLRNEQQFAKLETQRGDRFYLFSEWKAHPINEKTEFAIATLYLFSEKYQDVVWTAPLSSKGSYNLSLEWNFAYMRKIRAACTNQLKNCKYLLQRCTSDEEGMGDADNYMMFRIHFRMQNDVEILAFQAKLMPNYVSNPYHFLLDKLADFNSSKNKALEAHERQIQSVQEENTNLLVNNQQLIQQKADMENEMILKFVKILNEKKKRIRELEARIGSMRASGVVKMDESDANAIEPIIDDNSNTSVPRIDDNSRRAAESDGSATDEEDHPESQIFYQSFGDTQSFNYHFPMRANTGTLPDSGSGIRIKGEPMVRGENADFQDPVPKRGDLTSSKQGKEDKVANSLTDLFEDGASLQMKAGRKRKKLDMDLS